MTFRTGTVLALSMLLAHCGADSDGVPPVKAVKAALSGAQVSPDLPNTDVGLGGNGEAQTWDGRVFVSARSSAAGNGWWVHVLRPERITFNSDGTPKLTSTGQAQLGQGFQEFSPGVLLEENGENTVSGIEYHHALGLVPNPDVQGPNPYRSTSTCTADPSNDTYECYDMIIIASTLYLGFPYSDLVELVRIPAKVVVKNPRTLDTTVQFTSIGQMEHLTTTSGGRVGAYEPTVTVDGRVIVFNRFESNATNGTGKLFFVWNHTPASAQGWSDPTPISELSDNRDTLVDGVKFGDRYPVARGVMRDAEGVPFTGEVTGSYAWISPSGEELIYVSTGPTRRQGLVIFGDRTGHEVRHIDGMLNPDRTTTPRLFTSSPGALPSLWPPYPGMANSPFPYRPERPVLPVWSSNQKRYSEVSFRPFMDPHYLTFLEMNEMHNKTPDGNGILSVYTDKTPDTSGNLNYGLLGGGAGFPLEFKGVDEKLVGAKGQAIYFPKTGRVTVPDGGNLALNQNEKSISLHMFVKPTVNDGVARHLAYKVGSFEVLLTGGLTIRTRVWLEGQPNYYQLLSTSALTFNEWNAVGFTYDRVTGKLTSYVNGVPSNTLQAVVDTGVDWNPNNDFIIGPNGLSGGPASDVVMIDEVALSNVARTDFEMLREAYYRPNVGLPLGLDVDDLQTDAPRASTDTEVRLGEDLFFDPILSTNSKACGTCHIAGDERFTDSPAVTPAGVPRNTPTAINRAFSLHQMLDGRAESLEDQYRLPLLSANEMNNPSIQAVVDRLATSSYAARFQSLYGGPPTEFSLGRALAVFQRSLDYGNSHADQVDANVAGVSFSASEQRGRDIFFGVGRCVACHNGSNYTDERFHNTGLSTTRSDAGRMSVLDPSAIGTEFYEGAFKTPTLRDLSATGPYFHDGSAATLADVVHRYNLATCGDGCSVDPNRSAEIEPLGLSSGEEADLVAFLQTLASQEEYAADFISQSVPTEVAPGAQFQATLTFRNIGKQAWTVGDVPNVNGEIGLGSQSPENNTTWGNNRVTGPAATVAPGDTHSFTFTVTAPSQEGTYTFRWKPLKAGHFWFDNEASPGVSIIVHETYDAEFVSQTGVPTEIAPGAQFTPTVTMKNTGTMPWQLGPNTHGNVLLGATNPGGYRWTVGRIEGPSGTTIQPGQTYGFTATLTAPTDLTISGCDPVAEECNFEWHVLRVDFPSFGSTPSTAIHVDADWAAEFVSQSVPTQVAPGAQFQATLTFRNVGNKTWTVGSVPNVYAEIGLGSQSPENNTTWGNNRVTGPAATVPTGQTHSFVVTLTAPSQAGTYVFHWKPLKAGHFWLEGQASQSVSIVVADDWAAEFVSQSVPTQVAPGAQFQATLTFRNVGSKTWTVGSVPNVYAEIGLGSQSPENNTTWGNNRVTGPAATVPTGQTHSFVVTLTAPSQAGTYVFHWKPLKAGHFWLEGEASQSVSIVVQ